MSGMSGTSVAFATTTAVHEGGSTPDLRAFTVKRKTVVCLVLDACMLLLPTRHQHLTNPFLVSADPLPQSGDVDIEFFRNLSVGTFF